MLKEELTHLQPWQSSAELLFAETVAEQSAVAPPFVAEFAEQIPPYVISQ